MKAPLAVFLTTSALLTGCTSSPHSQEMVRRSTAAVTRTVASDVKGAALGIRDGLRHDPNNEPVDVNSAPKEKLVALPGLTPSIAQRVIDGRPYKQPAELVRRRILPKAVYSRVSSRLVAR